MIHYHGTPITPRSQLQRMNGRHFCVSYAEPRDLRPCLEIGQSVMLDNGAFSAFTRGVKPNWNQYYGWLEPVLTHPHFAIIPDVIDGTPEQQDELCEAWPFADYLGAPVWHLHEPIERLIDLVSAGWPRVCFGEYWIINSPKWCGRMDEAFNELVRQFTDIPWIHGLRMLGQCDGDWPLASADSTNVAQNFKVYGCAECMAARIDAKQPPSLWAPRDIQMVLS